jgi:hypothetical protein
MATRATLVVAALIVACKGTGGGTAGSTGSTGTMARSSEEGPILVCVHKDLPWSDWDCPDTIKEFLPIADMDSIILIVKTKSGATHTTPIPRNSDAIFLSKRSVDSILVRYYEMTKQGPKADAVRRRFQPPAK